MIRHVRRGDDPTADSRSSLNSDFIDKAARRLGLLAMVCAVSATVMVLVIPPPPYVVERGLLAVHYGVTGAFVVLSAAVFMAVRAGWVPTRRVAWFGFAFEIVGAVVLEIGLLYWDGDPQGLQLGFSATALWIVMFPLFAPTTPRMTLLAALLAASVRPFLLLLLTWQGLVMPDLGLLIAFAAPTYASVAIAVVGTRVVHGLAMDVTRARRLGSYELMEKLGQGGMGEVWRAHHSLLARPSAVKLIRVSGGTSLDDVRLHRFQREAQATSQLRSNHTVDVYDFGITEDQTFYYVMELLDGIDLQDLVSTYGTQPIGRVVHILRQVCDSLAEAHELGLIHRDIKPANLFLCRYGRSLDHLKVLDFGLVTAGTDQTVDSRSSNLTQPGMFYGTPNFASPEMAGGSFDRVDGRSDIYSLGCVAYWLLTGRALFESDSPMGVLVKHHSERPDPPSARSFLAVPPELDAIVLRCLAKDVDERYQTADALAGDLAPLAMDHPWSASAALDWWSQYRSGESGAVEATGLTVPGSLTG